MALLSIVIVISVLALLFAGYLTRQILRKYTTIAILTVALSIVIYAAYAFFGKNPELGWRTSVSFLFGAISSGLAGIVGMWVSIRANIRTASAARKSMNQAFVVAFRGGAV